jgi:Mg-dependent DNase
MVKGGDVRCLGEVGFDLKFTPNTIDRQRRFFEEFLRMAKEYDPSPKHTLTQMPGGRFTIWLLGLTLIR